MDVVSDGAPLILEYIVLAGRQERVSFREILRGKLQVSASYPRTIHNWTRNRFHPKVRN